MCTSALFFVNSGKVSNPERKRRKHSIVKVKIFLNLSLIEMWIRIATSSHKPCLGDSDHAIEGYSLNEAYRPHDEIWLKKHLHISRSDIVVVALRGNTHNTLSLVQSG